MRGKLLSAILSVFVTAALVFVLVSPLPEMALLSAVISLALFAFDIYLGRRMFIIALARLRYRKLSEELFASLTAILAVVCGIVQLFLGDIHSAGLLLAPASAAISLTLWSEYFSKRIVPEKPAPFGDILPTTATALLDGVETEVSTYELSEGDIVSVKPGEMIPCDGVILAGKSDIDERSISGGLLSHLHSEGDTVVAGTRNLSGFLTLRSSGTRTELDGMKRTFSESVPQRFAQKGITRFLPLISLAVAAVVFVIICLLRGFGAAVFGFTAVLAVLAPCGFGLCEALAALRVAAKSESNGLKIRNLWAISAMAQIKKVVFMRSGTATVGKLTVSEVVPLGDMSKDSVIRLAAALSDGTDGADFSAITEQCKLSDIAVPPCIGLERLPGQLSGIVDGVRTVLSAEPLDVGPYYDDYPQLNVGDKALRTVFFGGEAVGVIVLSDKIKPSAPAAVKALTERGIRAALISGGEEEYVSADAEILGARDFAAGLGPMEKERFIRGAKASGITAAVGDGFCDCAALVSADCSFAMASGADEAKAAASAVLLRNDLRDILTAIDLAKSAKIAARAGQIGMFALRAVTLALAAIVSTLVTSAAGSLILTGGIVISALVPVVSTKISIKNSTK